MAIKSPFPGMDPYLEAHWRDVHASLVIYLRDRLQPGLPRDLRARVEERVFIETDLGHCPHEPITETHIEIVDTRTGYKVVTVIEVLSRVNKTPGDGQKLYQKKQGEVLAARANLVEIDLLRSGEWVLAVERAAVPPSHRTPYRAVARRGHRSDVREYYCLPLRDRLPRIRVPLRESDQDVALDLQAAADDCYANGGYDDLDYRLPPDPPFSPADEAWADALLRSAGKR